jgi:hypothetical protein
MEGFTRTFSNIAKWLSLAIVPLCMIAIFLIIGLSAGEVILRGVRGKGITDSLDLITALVPVILISLERRWVLSLSRPVQLWVHGL